MKKIALILCLMAVSFAYSQEFKLTNRGMDLPSTYDFTVADLYEDNEFAPSIQNLTDNTISVNLRKEVITAVEGSTNTFCLGACVDESVLVSPSPLVLEAGQTSTSLDFHILYNPNGNYGTTTVKYVFYTDTYADSLTVNFISANSINEATAVSSFSAYPNPATSQVTFQYNLTNQNANAQIVITNLVGNKMRTIPVSGSNGKTSVDLSNLTAGIYFYSMEVDGKVLSTKKLIVK